VNVDASTIEINSDTLRVKDGGITTAKLAVLNAMTDADVGLTDEVPVYSAAAAANRNLSVERILGYGVPDSCNGRLTLETAVPISTSDQTAKTNVYFTPYLGNRVSLYDGTRWKLYTFTEKTLALGTITSGKNYDVFLYDNSGTLTLELSAAWTSDTARNEALATQDGIYVKSGSTTRRYLGTIRTTSTTTTEDSAVKRYVWNLYNQVPRKFKKQETQTTWTYASATFRLVYNGTNDPVVRAVVGKTGYSMASVTSLLGMSGSGGASGNTAIGVGTGSGSTTNVADVTAECYNGAASPINMYSTAILNHNPTEGLVEYCQLESARLTVSMTFLGTNSAANNCQSGLVGWILG
jgi:hypothetical protein